MNLIFSDIVCLLCLSCIAKKPQNNGQNWAETCVVLIVFIVPSVTSTLILLPFLTLTQHKSGTRQTISWSVTIYIYITTIYPVNAIFSAQVEPAQDEIKFSFIFKGDYRIFVMVSMIQLDQTKDYNIGICCFSVNHAVLRSIISEWSNMSTHKLLLQWASVLL
jgi:hypothetical protein